MFQYCCRCKVDFCEECANRFDFQEIDHRRNHLDFCIPVNKKKHICLEHTNAEFLEFCIDCQENICEKEKIERHRGHKKVSFLNNDIENYRRMIINKNKILSDIIRFNQLIINTYDKFPDNYFHIQSLINVGKSLEQENKRDPKKLENMMYSLEKSHKAQQEALSKLNNEFRLDFDGNETKLSLRERNLGNTGFKLLSKIQFTNLKNIDVSKNMISNIEELNNMNLPHLEYINVSENSITDIKPIAELNSKNLKEIFLQKNKIVDFSPFLKSQFPALERLRIENNNFNADLQEFKDLIKKYSKQIIYIAKTLEEFNKKYNVKLEGKFELIKLNDLRAKDVLLQELYNVINPDARILEISLRNNQIKDASLLSRIPFKHLRIIDLSMNEISNLNFILDMKSKVLKEIYLNDNHLNDISCLIKIYDPALYKEKENFPNLKVISLKNNLLKKDDKETKNILRLLKDKEIETDINDEN